MSYRVIHGDRSLRDRPIGLGGELNFELFAIRSPIFAYINYECLLISQDLRLPHKSIHYKYNRLRRIAHALTHTYSPIHRVFTNYLTKKEEKKSMIQSICTNIDF